MGRAKRVLDVRSIIVPPLCPRLPTPKLRSGGYYTEIICGFEQHVLAYGGAGGGKARGLGGGVIARPISSQRMT